jgi:hypothetical protein
MPSNREFASQPTNHGPAFQYLCTRGIRWTEPSMLTFREQADAVDRNGQRVEAVSHIRQGEHHAI